MTQPFVFIFPRIVTRNMFAVLNSYVKDVTNAISFAMTLFHSITHAPTQRKLLMFAMGD